MARVKIRRRTQGREVRGRVLIDGDKTDGDAVRWIETHF